MTENIIPSNLPEVEPGDVASLQAIPPAPRNRNKLLLLASCFLAAIFFVPVPYYDSGQVLCKPGQVNCPSPGWRFTPPLFSSIWSYFSSSSKVDTQLRSPAPSPSPETVITSQNPSPTPSSSPTAPIKVKILDTSTWVSQTCGAI